MKKIIASIVFLISFSTWAQDNSWYLNFIASDKDYYHHSIQSFSSKIELTNQLKKLRFKAINKGHVLASIDTTYWQNDTAYVRFYLGPTFSTIKILYDEKDAFLIRKSPQLNERLMRRLPFSAASVREMLKSLLRHLNNHGYPFAKVYLSIQTIQPQYSNAKLHIERGKLVRINKIHIKGKTKVKDKYIKNAIAIKKGNLYQLNKLRNISTKLAQVPFIKEIRPYELLFTPEGVDLYLYLQRQPVSSINGIIGLQPDPQTGKTTVTGDVQLQLVNVIRQGESFALQWRSLRPKTQDLNIQFQFPFLFNTPFGINADFQLYKEDTTYLNLNFRGSILYYLSGGSYLKIFYQGKKSNLLFTNIIGDHLAKISENRYGLGYYRNQVDYLPNPSRGFRIDTEIALGSRKSSPHQDSTQTTTTVSGSLKIEGFIPITPRNVIRLANSTHTYYAPTIYNNEFFQFGGLKQQRGFDESSLKGTTISTFTVEYRFLVDKNSHAFAFYDQTFYERNAKKYIKDTPLGFGLGYAFGTKFGTFSISYALGKQFNNPIRLKEGKIHFGYIAFF